MLSFNTNAGEIETYLTEKYQAATFRNVSKTGVGFSSAINADFFSFGYNIGFNVLSVNTTFGIGWQNYLTLNATMLGGEAILQRKVYKSSTDNAHGGISIGLFAKKDYYVYNKEARSMLDIFMGIHGIRDLAPIDVYGGRTMIHWRILYDAMIHGFVSYGYSPQLTAGIVNVGFVFGFDNFK